MKWPRPRRRSCMNAPITARYRRHARAAIRNGAKTAGARPIGCASAPPIEQRTGQAGSVSKPIARAHSNAGY
jgi:hypothetical protein